jgi:streptogramin lyase
MQIRRREFLTTLAIGAAATQFGRGQQEGPSEGQGGTAEPVKTWTPRVERLFKVEGMEHPNDLEATPEGLWVGDQVSEMVMRVDWQSGKVLYQVQAESHNLSGLAVGAGYLWIGSNGGVSGRRPPRPQDKPYGEISQIDMKTGKIVKLHRPVWGGGIHGTTWVPQTRSLWVTALSIGAVAELDVKDNMRILRMFPAGGTRAHGLDWDNGSVWVLFAGEREFRKFDPGNGKVLEKVPLSPADPDPHGICIRNGYMYYCDAGLTEVHSGTVPGMICRFRLDSGSKS